MDGTEIQDETLICTVTRPENNVSYATLTVSDYQSKNYVEVIDALDTLEVSFKYHTDSAWTKVFSGRVSKVSPQISDLGEILQVGGWGLGEALTNTHCNTSYGVESSNPAKYTPQDIIWDLIDNYVNLSLGAGATGWAVGKTKVENVHSGLSVTHLNSPYLDNFTVLNRLCSIVNAYAQGLGSPEVSIHWYVDTDNNLRVKKIDDGSTDGDWDRYWGGMGGTDPGTQASSTIEVKKDMVLYDFRKNVDEYANNVLLACTIRKPPEDNWNEGRHADWGTSFATLSSDAANKVVGANSLKMVGTDNAHNMACYWPSSQDAAWDLSKLGSEKSVPTINFYARRNKAVAPFASYLQLNTNAANLFHIDDLYDYIAVNNEFVALSFPIGPYYNVATEEKRQFRWLETDAGALDWNNINYVVFSINPLVDLSANFWCDDLHFSGNIVREAYNSTSRTANKETQKFKRVDMALDDTLKASDDSGTAAALAYAELLRRDQTPIVGLIRIPLAPSLLPGQTVYPKACKQSGGTFRIEKDMRVVELRHVFGKPPDGCFTVVNLTDDVSNSHAFGVPTAYSLLKEYAGALGHQEARDLKSSGIDNLVARLSIDYA